MQGTTTDPFPAEFAKVVHLTHSEEGEKDMKRFDARTRQSLLDCIIAKMLGPRVAHIEDPSSRLR